MYQENISIIHKNKSSIYPCSESLDEIYANLEKKGLYIDAVRPQHIYDILDTEGEKQNEEDNLEEVVEHENYVSTNLLTADDTEENENKTEKSIYKSIEVYDEQQMLDLARNLVPEQRFAFDLIVDYAKKVVKCRKSNKPLPLAPKIVIHGGAGTGKSFCIKSIS